MSSGRSTQGDAGASAGTGDRGGRWWAALAGVVAGAVTIAVASLVAALLRTEHSPLSALASAVVDASPPWLVEFAKDTFGTADKSVLAVCVVVVAGVLSAVAGLVARRSFVGGAAVVVALSAVVAAAAAARPGGGATDVAAVVVGAVAGLVVLRSLVARVPAGEPDRGATRRSFLGATGVAALVAVGAGVGARVASGAARAVQAVRDTIVLPVAATPVAPPPEGVQSPVPGVVPFVTPNDDFYRIDTAIRVPVVDPATWRLRIHGLVEREVEIDFAELLERDLVEARVTLTCVSNPVGGDLAGNALWLGLPVRELLAEAGPLPDADMVLSRSVDGFTASTPIEALTDGRDALLAVGMNGEPLPVDHGFPVRLVVPGLYGFVSATKWVVDLEVTRFDRAEAYWTERGWSERGPVKTASRIDVPRTATRAEPGVIMVGGTAWAQHRGVVRVEIRVDDGEWHDADLAAEDTIDTWRQWSYAWDATEVTSGDHRITVRAWDADGPQPEGPVDVVPDGAEGWHHVSVRFP
ncbi:oxidoreductase molybdopterin binding [Beutenbergia cavernae DSM 12333]|uniref:Oxidoreductase molybdopterin binding n=1 Tax=Beutenbergia cavernae (strain ATCC BAA-8 / DSM 12333 / CCUG 43141 / JCM 11478 / NBRC 16432 / NCIMB 13614 / HKI 0122) TaxID=471853 RepID=C5C407_BEUC1|nr:molybdopterin-dependent oxidoreductase [Beutenbergia cavernae]ACQ79920.1 oxidoreductase molybdopterin binding [Beutenbergia cavernae DSM 12333]